MIRNVTNIHYRVYFNFVKRNDVTEKLSEIDCDSVNYMIGLSTNTPFRVHQRTTNLIAAQHVLSVKFSVKKINATILGHHIGSLRRIAGSA